MADLLARIEAALPPGDLRDEVAAARQDYEARLARYHHNREEDV